MEGSAGKSGTAKPLAWSSCCTVLVGYYLEAQARALLNQRINGASNRVLSAPKYSHLGYTWLATTVLVEFSRTLGLQVVVRVGCSSSRILMCSCKLWGFVRAGCLFLRDRCMYVMYVMYVCMNACMHVCLSVCLSVRPSVCLSVGLSVSLSVYVCVYVCMSTYNVTQVYAQVGMYMYIHT